MRKIEFNLNDYVWIELTDEGKKIYKEYYRSESMLINQKTEGKLFRFQLHEVMNIFGKYMYMGNNNFPFKMNVFFEVQNTKITELEKIIKLMSDDQTLCPDRTKCNDFTDCGLCRISFYTEKVRGE